MRRDHGPELLVLGLGNLLCGDDGLGIEAVRRLQGRYTFPEGVQLLDGGTLGLTLLGHLADAKRVLLVDAIDTGAEPGTLVRLAGSEVAPAVRERLSVHQVGVADLLDGLHLIGAYPPTLVLVGLVPATMELHVGLSSQVAAALPALLDAVEEEMAVLGFPPQPRPASASPREVDHGQPDPSTALSSLHPGAGVAGL